MPSNKTSTGAHHFGVESDRSEIFNKREILRNFDIH